VENNIGTGSRETGVDQGKRLPHFFIGAGVGFFERRKNRIAHHFCWRHAGSDRTGDKPRLHAAAAICNQNMVEVDSAFPGLVENLNCTGDISQTADRARSTKRTYINFSPLTTQRCGSLFRNLQRADVSWNVMNDGTKEAV
jgi:hypothetical protein